MLTPKQEFFLKELQSKFPGMFKTFQLEPVESPEHKLSIQRSQRVQHIIHEISKAEIIPRTVSREMSYHEQIIDMWSRKYVHPPGAPCPF